MKKYTVDGYEAKITEVEIISESAKFVTYNDKFWNKPRREMKADNYFDSWDAAKAFLVEKYESKVQYARKALESANAKLGNAKGLQNIRTEPTSEASAK